jgi:autotransporter-associated beta strand protein
MNLCGIGGPGTVDTTGGDMGLSGNLSGGGGLVKAGGGTLTLSGADSYTGLTTISGGTLALDVAAGAAWPVLSGGGADVQGGTLVFDYASGSDPLASVEAALKSGYSNGWASGQIHNTSAANGWELGCVDDGAGTITVEPALPGDANLDGCVDVNDLTIVLSNFGRTAGATWGQGDFEYDGTVDINDLTIVLANFGTTVESPAASGIRTVPEPGAIALLLAGAGCLLGLVWRRCLKRRCEDEPVDSCSAKCIARVTSRGAAATSRHFAVVPVVMAAVLMAAAAAVADQTGPQFVTVADPGNAADTTTVSCRSTSRGLRAAAGRSHRFVGLGSRSDGPETLGSASGAAGIPRRCGSTTSLWTRWRSATA